MSTIANITALQQKEIGNDYFQQQNYTSAVASYRLALKLVLNENENDDDNDDSSSSKTLESQIRSNIALCYQKFGLYKDAEEECRKAFSVDVNNPKLWYRRSQIREQMTPPNYRGAFEDMRRCVELFESREKNKNNDDSTGGWKAAQKALVRLGRLCEEEERIRNVVKQEMLRRQREEEDERIRKEEGGEEKKDADGDDSLEEEQQSCPKKKKGKKSKKKKKKKTNNNNNSSGNNTPSSTTTTPLESSPQSSPPKLKHSVSFGTVSVREYRRCLGTHVIPNDGGWPLGLSHEIVLEKPLGNVDEFERNRQMELRKRYADVTGAEGFGRKLSKDEVLETRQLDYKKRCVDGSTPEERGVNVLFEPYREEERKEVLLRDVDVTDESVESEVISIQKLKKSCSKKQKQSSRRNLEEDCIAPYTSCEILSVRNEVEQIRSHRSLSDQGCDCRKSNLFSKSKHHKKKHVPERRLKEELRKRGMTSETHLSKNEMECALMDVVKQEPCCRDDNCPCVKSGIGCQADVCGCWEHSEEKELDLEGVKEVCGNRFGMDVVDKGKIRKHWSKVMSDNKMEKEILVKA